MSLFQAITSSQHALPAVNKRQQTSTNVTSRQHTVPSASVPFTFVKTFIGTAVSYRDTLTDDSDRWPSSDVANRDQMSAAFTKRHRSLPCRSPALHLFRRNLIKLKSELKQLKSNLKQLKTILRQLKTNLIYVKCILI